jgi:rhomboid protease GluP
MNPENAIEVPTAEEQETPPEPPSPPRFQPSVTYAVLAVTVLVYLLQIGTRTLVGYDLPAAYGIKDNGLIEAGQYWRLFTPLLLHGSFIHLAFNMYALYVLGGRLERFFGHTRFLGLYLISGFAGNIMSMALTEAPSLGSSTAIFGILAAEGVFLYQHRNLTDQSNRALRQIIQVAVINLVIGISPGIDNWGHIGGLLGGLAFTWWAGPALQVVGYTVEDVRKRSTVLTVFLGMLLVLSLLVAGLINLRGTP